MVDKVWFNCPSCGAGMEIDRDAGTQRCLYCNDGTQMPGARVPGAGEPVVDAYGGPPRVLATTKIQPVAITLKGLRPYWPFLAIIFVASIILLCNMARFLIP